MDELHEQEAIESIRESLAPTLEEEVDLESEAASDAMESEEGGRYDFDVAFQSKIASLAIRDVNFNRRTEGLIKPDYFEDGIVGLVVALAQEHYNTYKTTPSVASWQEIINTAKAERRIRSDQMPLFKSKLSELYKSDISDGDFVIDKVSDFARGQAVKNGFLDAYERFEKGDIFEAQKILEDAFSVGAMDEFEDFEFWEDSDRRYEVRKQKAAGLIQPDGVPTGISKLDNFLYHKGWGRKELSVLMGGPKMGKSMALGEFALRASRLGYNALYVSLEVSTAIILDRMDANVSGITMHDLEDHISDVRDKVSAASASIIGSKARGTLKVCDFPSGSLKPSGLKRVLEKYRAEGTKFDLICVDYADIMAPEVNLGSEIQNSKSIWLALRAIAFEENAALLTATQTNREGYTSSVARAEHAADDFNKIRIADIVISINKDEEEIRNGKARLYFAASRNQRGDVTFNIDQDTERMRFITKVEAPKGT